LSNSPWNAAPLLSANYLEQEKGMVENRAYEIEKPVDRSPGDSYPLDRFYASLVLHEKEIIFQN